MLLAADNARQILDQRKALEDGERRWTDRHQHMRMRISSRSAQREREIDVYERRYPDGAERAIVFVRAPAELRNVAFLSISTKGKSAEQWLYLPTHKRVRKITMSTRTEAFVSSDLTFHDLDLLGEMPRWSGTDISAQLRSEERIDDVPCHAIDMQPQRDDISYRRIVLWLGRDDLVARQIELYKEAPASGWFGGGGADANGKPTKRIRQRDITPAGKIPVARRIDVETIATGTRTEIEIVAVEHDQGLPDSLFTQRALELGVEGVGAAQ